MPSKPINLNSYAGNRYEKLLWFKEFGFITEKDLPKVDLMVLALIESSNHYYRKEYKNAVDYANQAININKDLALSKIFKGNLGEANYEVGNYKEAIELLTLALKNDTAGNVRIMNFVVPDFEFRAKSYLKLGDTINAIRDYEMLAVNNWSDSWGEVGILYRKINNDIAAKNSFNKGIKKYLETIDDSKKQKYDVELNQLSLLELYIISEDFILAEVYAETLKGEIKKTSNITLLAYLSACAKIGNNKIKEVNFPFLENIILKNKKDISSWSYELFFKWLRVTKIQKEKEVLMRKLTDLIKPTV